MAVFEYVGRNPAGKEKSGRVNADHRRQALLIIKEKGISVLQLTERRETIWTKDIRVSSKVKLREKVMFLRQFATIITAGVTVAEALQILSEQLR
jgi:type IV pilus assembly protein PilC